MRVLFRVVGAAALAAGAFVVGAYCGVVGYIGIGRANAKRLAIARDAINTPEDAD